MSRLKPLSPPDESTHSKECVVQMLNYNILNVKILFLIVVKMFDNIKLKGVSIRKT